LFLFATPKALVHYVSQILSTNLPSCLSYFRLPLTTFGQQIEDQKNKMGMTNTIGRQQVIFTMERQKVARAWRSFIE